jgi:hypothetical protein
MHSNRSNEQWSTTSTHEAAVRFAQEVRSPTTNGREGRESNPDTHLQAVGKGAER